ncbi:MAG TPA: HD domain-containing protein [Candidatus Paceibacterota bacterium]
MINQKNIKEIKKLGIKIDHDIAFGGKSKGNKHLFRAVKIAKYLATKTKADLSIVETGTWLHDTALPSGNDYNYENNKKIVMSLLSPINISQIDKDLIAECVASHEGTEKPKTLEAKIVHDADVLEKLGILGIIRHTWKMTNSNEIDPELINDRDVKKVLEHIKWRNKKLQTPIAKKIARYLNVPISIKNARIIVLIASKNAMNGVITEKIAVLVRKHLNKQQKEKLEEQLNLSYLNKF